MTISDGRRQEVHRLSYEIHLGSIPKGYDVDHLCFVRDCVNPKHLQAVPASENRSRMRKTLSEFCKHGHSEFRTIIRPSNGRPQRYCKACARLHQVKRYAGLSDEQKSVIKSRATAWNRANRKRRVNGAPTVLETAEVELTA